MTDVSENNKERDDVMDHVTAIEDNLTTDVILQQLGGCGRFQKMLAFVVHSMNLAIAWSTGSSSFLAFVPKWRCADMAFAHNGTSGFGNDSTHHVENETTRYEYWNQKCELPSGEKCQHFEFENSIHSIVSEFDLVCSRSWVTAFIISAQMAGGMVASFVVGHLSDIFGRKKPLILSIAMLVISHLICYLSVNWIMFCAGRVFVGMSTACFLCINSVLQGEYMVSKWRGAVINFPSWAIAMCLFTLIAWLVPDWKWITLIIIIGSFCSLGSWFFIPESFRWLVARGRHVEAGHVVHQLEKWNRRPAPEFDKVVHAFTKDSQTESENYSFLILFRNKSLLTITLPLITGWLSYGVISYGIGFGLKKLSGNFFLNLFLFSTLSIPSKIITIYMQNFIGRRYTIALSFGTCMISGGAIGCIRYIETPLNDKLITGFSLAAGAGVEAAWGPLQTLTVELYPTVARTTGFGFLSVIVRLGAVIGPQLVYLDDYIPGVLYFVVSGLAAVSVCCVLCLRETMNTTLLDKLSVKKEKNEDINDVIIT